MRSCSSSGILTRMHLEEGSVVSSVQKWDWTELPKVHAEVPWPTEVKDPAGSVHRSQVGTTKPNVRPLARLGCGRTAVKILLCRNLGDFSRHLRWGPNWANAEALSSTYQLRSVQKLVPFIVTGGELEAKEPQNVPFKITVFSRNEI